MPDAPAFLGVCAPHEEAGPWGELVPYVPRSAAEREAALIVAARAAEDARSAGGGDDAAGSEEVEDRDAIRSRDDWETAARADLAVELLVALRERFGELRIDVLVEATAENRRAVLESYHDPAALWFTVDDERRSVVSTRDPRAVAFLTGVRVTRELVPFVTVAVRAREFAAALFFDYDVNRFYVAEPGEDIIEAAIRLAGSSGVRAVRADGETFVMRGTPDIVAALTAWARDAGGNLPPDFA